jgi:pimeloyl-ACP methyl ester carboxylesterase
VRGKLAFLLPVLVGLAAVLPTGAQALPAKGQLEIWSTIKLRPAAKPGKPQVRIWRVHYRAHDGQRRRAFIALPFWYGKHNNPPIPLVISPHGRGVGARANAKLWGALPNLGTFAVISPEGAGRELARYSWGAVGQIRDLARMPAVARRTLPWLRIDTRRIYAFGGSMGGQETLLLLARHPKLLAGAAAFDAVTDFARQYRSFTSIRCDKACRRLWNGPIGKSLQSLARQETGGTPKTSPGAYTLRSPLTYVRSIAASCVPLQLWWSRSDRIVVNQRHQSQALFREVKRINPQAPVQAYVGYWAHSREMHARTRLPLALAAFGLLPSHSRTLLRGMDVVPEPVSAPRCGASPAPAEPRSRADGKPWGRDAVKQYGAGKPKPRPSRR